VASVGEALYGGFSFLMERPTDAGDDLESADGAGEGRAFLQVAHESFPGRGAVFPGEGVVLWTDDRHDAVADESHGCEVFPTPGCEGHGHRLTIRGDRGVGCCLQCCGMEVSVEFKD
jgi:hypothetical protein